jgi:hypothetical protein
MKVSGSVSSPEPRRRALGRAVSTTRFPSWLVKRLAMTAVCVTVALVAAGGCGGEEKETTVKIPMSQVPGPVFKAAEAELKGVAFDAAYREKVKRRETFRLKGKDVKTGKAREVEVSREGKVLSTK